MSELDNLKLENQKLKSELEQVKKGNIQYLQNVAHQLTAPLGAIKWSIEALEDQKVPFERKKKLFKSVYSQATILVHYIKNFTLLSNLDADIELGQFREQPEPVDIRTLAINLANDFQPQANDVHKKIILNDDSFDNSIGHKKIKIVKNLVAQAISNILENAVKYANQESTIIISAGINGGVYLSITSAGIPIKQEETKNLFERGYRGESARQKVPAGTGFGLYLVSRIMKMHNGKVVVHVKENTSMFTLVFPKDRLI